MRTKRNPVRLVVFAAALLAAVSFGGPAKAQSIVPLAAFQGKFTLPFQVHWGKAVLPPGDYLLTFSKGVSPVIQIEDVKSRRHVALEPTTIRQGHCTGESALNIGARGTERVVDSLQLKELGETFVSPANRSHGQEAEEARHAKTVRVFVAKK